MRISTILAVTAILAAAAPAVASPTSLSTSQEKNSSKQISAPAAPPALSSISARVAASLPKIRAGDFAGARIEVAAAVADPQFPTVPAKGRHAALILLALCEAMTGDGKLAYEHLMQAGPTTEDSSDGAYYFAMGFAGAATDHWDEALNAMTWMAEHNPQVMSQFDLSYMLSLSSHAGQKADSGASRKRFLEALWASHYTSPDIYYSADRLWFSLFEDEVAAGNDAKAREIMTAFVDPETAIRLRCDKRYARFAAADPAHADFQALLTASIDRARDLMAAHPKSAEAVYNLADRLANAGRLDEALKLTDDALAKVAAGGGKPVYDDQAEKLQWVHMTRGIAMERQGRNQEMLKTQEQARDTALSGGAGSDSVSQPINLGGEYIAAGRPKDALDAVKNVDGKVSPYGRMAAMQVRACAYAQLGDTAGAAEAMTYMKAHISDGYGPFKTAMLCIGDDVGMAQVLIKRLEDPMTRDETLFSLQGFLTTPGNAFTEKLKAVWQRTRTRDDVQAAIAKYGTLEKYAIYRPIEG